ncbi:MAG: hypothetical protein M3O22_05405 [Pseudomonadota bacterium]|nr:hypothetical protein [Pseudomonadota bacterium]
MRTSKFIILGSLALAVLGGSGYALASRDSDTRSSDTGGWGLGLTYDTGPLPESSAIDHDEKMEQGVLDVTITLTSTPESAAKGISVNRQVSFSLPLINPGPIPFNAATTPMDDEDFPEDEAKDHADILRKLQAGAKQQEDASGQTLHQESSADGKVVYLRGPDNGLGHGATIEYGDTKMAKRSGIHVETGGYMEDMSEGRYVNWLPDVSDIEDDVETSAQRKNCAQGTASISDKINNADLRSSRTVTQKDRGGFMCNTALTYDTETKTWALRLGHANRLSMPLTANGTAVLKETDLFAMAQPLVLKDIKPGKDGTFSVTRNDVATLPTWNNAGQAKDTPLVMNIRWSWKTDAAPKTPDHSGKAPAPSDETDDGWVDMLFEPG